MTNDFEHSMASDRNIDMVQLNDVLSTLGTPDFEATLKHEITQLDASRLPLQQGLSSSNYVADDPITVIVNHITEKDEVIRIKVGIFYKGIIGGCSCTDDPTPDSKNSEYCEVQLDIDRATGITTVALVTE